MFEIKITNTLGVSIERHYDEDSIYNIDWNTEVVNAIDTINNSTNNNF
jgi:hypothetical protein